MNETKLWASPIFGPVHSRRLGISLGINLQPGDGKVCSFDCIYCECGLNNERRPHSKRPTREAVAAALEAKLKAMKDEGEVPDVLTFAGNGEPTGHPLFPEIIDDTIRLRNIYCPEAKISVLSNATFCGKEKVREALMRIDNNIQKLDTVDNSYINKVDRPTLPSYDVKEVIEWLKAFNGKCIIQTMFMEGTNDGESVSNTADSFVNPWLEAVKDITPQQVMIYTIDRTTPVETLQKASPERLNEIRDKVIAMGIPCSASY